MREAIKKGGVSYFDMHLSHLAQGIRYGFLPRPKYAIVEACRLSDDGSMVPTAGVGITPTICQMAEHIIVELNEAMPASLEGIHDIYQPLDSPSREPNPICHVSHRAGDTVIKADPAKIIGGVKTNVTNIITPFVDVDTITPSIDPNLSCLR